MSLYFRSMAVLILSLLSEAWEMWTRRWFYMTPHFTNRLWIHFQGLRRTRARCAAMFSGARLYEVALNQRKMALQAGPKCVSWNWRYLRHTYATSVALWNRACERAQWLSRFRLDEIATNNDRALIALKRPWGPGERLAGIRVWMKTPVDTAFEGIELTKAGTYWKAAEDTALIPGPFKYYIDFSLVAGDGYRSARLVIHWRVNRRAF